MKKIFLILTVFIGFTGCEDQDIDFQDNTWQSVYFPVQLPLRTLSLGEDRIDNSLDKEGKFDIGVSIGGMYENNKDWTVGYLLDPSLTDSVYTSPLPRNKILPLPGSYYTIEPQNTVTIPKGSMNGLIRITVNDQFFNDTLSTTGRYVIPLRLTETSADSILEGKALSNIAVPDRRIAAHWEASMSPRDWVLFGIKYYNAYHGFYLHRGRDIRITTSTGIPFDTIIFRNKYIERDLVTKLTTIGLRKVMTNRVGNLTGANYSMQLEFANTEGASGSVTITPRPGLPYAVTGSGQYLDKETSTETWSLLKWPSMHLSYTYQDATYTHQVTDTLVFRDRDMKFEQLSITIINPPAP